MKVDPVEASLGVTYLVGVLIVLAIFVGFTWYACYEVWTTPSLTLPGQIALTGGIAGFVFTLAVSAVVMALDL